jgi:histidine triad (HIT) family protein
MNCPYCPIREPEQKIVLEGEGVLFLQDERYQGALKHSGVIIPIQHRETVFDMSDAELAATFRLLRRVKQWMDDCYSPDGYNIGWNCGRIGGQEVFHAHLHVMPRFRQEPLAGTGIRSLLKSDANRWE